MTMPSKKMADMEIFIFSKMGEGLFLALPRGQFFILKVAPMVEKRCIKLGSKYYSAKVFFSLPNQGT